MPKDPAFLFYASDFLTGTTFMSNEQVGIYIRLLCAQHQHGGLIDKDSFNAMVGDFKLLRNKFVETDEGFYNIKLTTIMEARNKKSNNLSEAAKDIWKKRKEKNEQFQNNSNTIVQKKRTKVIQPVNVTVNEIKDYFKDNGYIEQAAIKFFEYYNSAGWKDSNGKPVKSWKQKAQGVWFKEENKIKEQSTIQPTIITGKPS